MLKKDESKLVPLSPRLERFKNYLNNEQRLGCYAHQHILTEESNIIKEIVGAKGYARYTLSERGWKNYITSNLHELDAYQERHADPTKVEEKAFHLFETLDKEFRKTGLTNQWLDDHRELHLHWCSDVEGKVRIMEMRSFRNPQQWLIFVTLGKVPGTDMESVMLLRGDKEFDLRTKPKIQQQIVTARTIAVEAYRERSKCEPLEIPISSLPIYESVYGRAWITYDDIEDVTAVPDDVLQSISAMYTDALADSFVKVSAIHLASPFVRLQEMYDEVLGIEQKMQAEADPNVVYAHKFLEQAQQILSTQDDQIQEVLRNFQNELKSDSPNAMAPFILLPTIFGQFKQIYEIYHAVVFYKNLGRYASGHKYVAGMLQERVKHLAKADNEKHVEVDESTITCVYSNAVKALKLRQGQHSVYEALQKFIADEKEKIAKITHKKSRDALKNALIFLESLLRRFRGAEESKIPQNSIVIGRQLTDSQISDFLRHNVLGAVSIDNDSGSHFAVKATGLQFPVAVGEKLKNILDYVDQGDVLLLSPSARKLIIYPLVGDGKIQFMVSNIVPEHIKAKALKHQDRVKQVQEFIAHSSPKQVYWNGAPILLKANATSASVDGHLFTDSVGLYRMEFEIDERGEVLEKKDWIKKFKVVISEYPGGLTLRTLDEGRDKAPIEGLPPILPGQSIIDYTRDNPIIMQLQTDYIDAAFEVSAEYKEVVIDLMHPMISSAQDMAFYRELVEQRRQAGGYEEIHFKQGAMIETVQGVENREEIIAVADYISIGTNDLTLSVLGTAGGREKTRVIDGLSPEVIGAIRRIVVSAKVAGKKVKICGQMAADPLIACILLSLVGNIELSMDKASIPLMQEALDYFVGHELSTKINEKYSEIIQNYAETTNKRREYIDELYAYVASLFADSPELASILLHK